MFILLPIDSSHVANVPEKIIGSRYKHTNIIDYIYSVYAFIYFTSLKNIHNIWEIEYELYAKQTIQYTYVFDMTYKSSYSFTIIQPISIYIKTHV